MLTGIKSLNDNSYVSSRQTASYIHFPEPYSYSSNPCIGSIASAAHPSSSRHPSAWLPELALFNLYFQPNGLYPASDSQNDWQPRHERCNPAEGLDYVHMML